MKSILDVGVLGVLVLLVAACPVGDVANLYVILARANVALSAAVNTLSILFSPAMMALGSAVAITPLNHIEYYVFGVVYFLAEVPPLLGAVAMYRTWGRRPGLLPPVPGTPR